MPGVGTHWGLLVVVLCLTVSWTQVRAYFTDGDQTSVTPLVVGKTPVNVTQYYKSGNYEKLMCFNFHENENASYVSGKLAAFLYGGRFDYGIVLFCEGW